MLGTGTLLDPYVIQDVNDLQDMANGAPYAANAYYELGADIDATPTATWNWNAGRGVFEGFFPRGTVLTPFIGHFNGNWHIITGLHEDWYSNAGHVDIGLFGYVTTGAQIQNVFILNANMRGYTTGTDNACRGGVMAGWMDAGTAFRVFTTGTIWIRVRDTWDGDGHARCDAGGLIGEVYGGGPTIDQCASYVNVTGTGYQEATVHAGGLIGGFNNGTIRDSFARGNVSGTHESYAADAAGLVGHHVTAGTIDNSYSTGAVTGNDNTSGLVGGPAAFGVTDSFWDVDTSGQATSQGGTGLNTPAMKTQATFTAAGWDFATIWDIDLAGAWNDGYPFFRWNPIPTITVTSPNGGEEWKAGTTNNITWTFVNNPDTHVMIELLKGGVFDELIIASNPIAPGTYAWAIDHAETRGDDYRVKITGTTNPYEDTSDNDFRIIGACRHHPILARQPRLTTKKMSSLP